MDHVLELPQVRLVFGRKLFLPQVLLVAGGRPPQTDWLAQVAAGIPVWCVDRGIDICQTSGVMPQRLIGDGDSASSLGWAWGRSLNIPVDVYPPEKDLTDLQLALQTVGSEYGQATVLVTGVWGGRFDHTFSNIYSLLGCDSLGIQGCCAADEREVLILLKGSDTLEIKMNSKADVVSLLPLTDCLGVWIDGVRWPLTAVNLQPAWPYAISNRPVKLATEVTVAVEKGWLGVYLCWNQNSLKDTI